MAECRIDWDSFTLEQWFNLTIDQWFNLLIEQDYLCGTEFDSLGETNEFIEDLIDRRGLVTAGGNPIRFVELVGGEHVEVTAFEPDPVTFRGSYYYHAGRNVLYTKVITQRLPTKIAHWKQVS